MTDASPPADASAPLLPTSAVERLEASRARLRTHWLREAQPDSATGASRESPGDSRLDRMREAVASGWAKHPLKGWVDSIGEVAGPSAHAALEPIARTHPMRLVAIAVGVGALVVWIKPWRVLPRAALSSLLFSIVLPRSLIVRWLLSGRWMGLLDKTTLSGWFGLSGRGDAGGRDRRAAREPATGSAPRSPADIEPRRSARASYVRRARAPMSAPPAGS